MDPVSTIAMTAALCEPTASSTAPDVLAPVLPGWGRVAANRIRDTGAAAIERDEPADGAQTSHEPSNGWHIPGHVDVVAEAIGNDQIDRALTDDLIAHQRATDLDVVGLRWKLAHGAQSWPARTKARQEADELGREPSGTGTRLWHEGPWGAVVLLGSVSAVRSDAH